MKYYKNGKQITKKEAIEWLGEQRFDARVADAKEAHAEDPNEEISWMDGFEIRF